VESLDLTYSVRNIRRDLANGFVIAEILSRYMPEKEFELKSEYTREKEQGRPYTRKIDLYTFYNGSNLTQKLDNWKRIANILKGQNF